ncbi:MAG: DUF4157 domain-containing protein, partial [Deltaproteobacteria bacterium]|nr:DUF4157 domain-containing protein [Deltaproteobacteria bacterium]
IHFGAGQYDPSTSTGEHLLAHEVAHTVQQRGGTPTRQNKLAVSSPGDTAEYEADRAADAMVSGGTAIIASAPAGTQRLVQREAAPEGGGGEPAGGGEHKEGEGHGPMAKTININSEMAFGKPVPLGRYFELSASGEVKGVMQMTEVGSAEPGSTGGVSTSTKGGVGIKIEKELAAKKALVKDVSALHFTVETAPKLTTEITTEKVDIGVGQEAKVYSEKMKWLQGALEVNAKALAIETKELSKFGKEAKIAAVEAAWGMAGEGEWEPEILKDTKLKGNLAVAAKGMVRPNWAEIAKDVGRRVMENGAKEVAKDVAVEAAEGIVVDSAGVAASAAAFAVPIAAAALMVYGAMQEEKNTVASRAAIKAGLTSRTEAANYAKAYARVLTGGEATGPGATAAEAKVAAYMGASKKDRAAACADIAHRNGGYAKIYGDIFEQVRPMLYDKCVAAFEEKFKDQFGLIEKIGETWGMRGVFRRELRGMIYADQQ